MTTPITVRGADLNGIRTRTLSVEGDGPPILLVHGFTDSADSWRPLLGELAARGRRAVAVDLPGSGRPDHVPGGARLARLDVFTDAFVRAHSADQPVVLAGNSLGGLLALRAASRSDLPLAAVAGLGPAGVAYGRRLERIERGVRVFAPLLYRLPVPRAPLRRAAERLYERWLSEGRADPSLARRYASHLDGATSVRRSTVALLAITGDDREDPLDVTHISVPTLLIWGGRDKLCALEGAQPVLDAVERSRLVVLPDCGH
jgi:pimeloyl-ACP methyl ester carboxylesterase